MARAASKNLMLDFAKDRIPPEYNPLEIVKHPFSEAF